MDRRMFLLSALVLSGSRQVGSPLWQKQAYAAGVAESSVFVHKGQPLLIAFKREFLVLKKLGVEVRNYVTDQLLASFQWPGYLGCAIVVNNVVHIFGSDESTSPQRIVHSTLDASYLPSAPQVVYQSSDILYNTSVCASPNGFTMALETSAGGMVFFQAPSIDGPWTRLSGAFNRAPDFYAAAPKILYRNGLYYLFYLEALPNPLYQTRVARSPNLQPGSWKIGARIVLSPDTGEGCNASDLDFEEFDFKILGVYFDGDQATWGDTKKCRYIGTMDQFLAEFF